MTSLTTFELISQCLLCQDSERICLRICLSGRPRSMEGKSGWTSEGESIMLLGGSLFFMNYLFYLYNDSHLRVMATLIYWQVCSCFQTMLNCCLQPYRLRLNSFCCSLRLFLLYYLICCSSYYLPSSYLIFCYKVFCNNGPQICYASYLGGFYDFNWAFSVMRAFILSYRSPMLLSISSIFKFRLQRIINFCPSSFQRIRTLQCSARFSYYSCFDGLCLGYYLDLSFLGSFFRGAVFYTQSYELSSLYSFFFVFSSSYFVIILTKSASFFWASLANYYFSLHLDRQFLFSFQTSYLNYSAYSLQMRSPFFRWFIYWILFYYNYLIDSWSCYISFLYFSSFYQYISLASSSYSWISFI